MLYSRSESENWSAASAMTRRTMRHVVTVSTSMRILKIPRGFDLMNHLVRDQKHFDGSIFLATRVNSSNREMIYPSTLLTVIKIFELLEIIDNKDFGIRQLGNHAMCSWCVVCVARAGARVRYSDRSPQAACSHTLGKLELIMQPMHSFTCQSSSCPDY